MAKFDPRRIHTPKAISKKTVTVDYVGDPYLLLCQIRCANPSMGIFWGNGWNITKNIFSLRLNSDPTTNFIAPFIKNLTSEMQLLYLLAWLSGPTGGAYSVDRICTPEKVIKMLHGRLVHICKTFNRFANFELWIAPKCVWRPGYAWTRWGSYSAPPDSLAIIGIWGRRNSRKRNTHTHTHPFNGPFSGTTRASGYQKGKTNLDFTEARDSEWQWHQLGHM